mmetsp:Transcript_38426/g.116194  ORF Transcript_38426/g.116194 Transcript_38426/m.116194 type:complete len:208 (-) Transcript_38426:653-1276(-)
MKLCWNSVSLACWANATRSARLPLASPFAFDKSTPCKLPNAASKCAATGSSPGESCAPERLLTAALKAPSCIFLSPGNLSLKEAAASLTTSSCMAAPMLASNAAMACSCFSARSASSSLALAASAARYAEILDSASSLKPPRYSTHLASFANRRIELTMASSPSMTSWAVFWAAMYSLRRQVFAMNRFRPVHMVYHTIDVPNTFTPK